MLLSEGRSVISSAASVSHGASLKECVVLEGVVLDDDAEFSNAIISQAGDGQLNVTQL